MPDEKFSRPSTVITCSLSDGACSKRVRRVCPFSPPAQAPRMDRRDASTSDGDWCRRPRASRRPCAPGPRPSPCSPAGFRSPSIPASTSETKRKTEIEREKAERLLPLIPFPKIVAVLLLIERALGRAVLPFHSPSSGTRRVNLHET